MSSMCPLIICGYWQCVGSSGLGVQTDPENFCSLSERLLSTCCIAGTALWIQKRAKVNKRRCLPLGAYTLVKERDEWLRNSRMIIKPCRSFLPARLAHHRAVRGTARRGFRGHTRSGARGRSAWRCALSQTDISQNAHPGATRPAGPGGKHRWAWSRFGSAVEKTIYTPGCVTAHSQYWISSFPAGPRLLALLLCVNLGSTGHFPNLLGSTCPERLSDSTKPDFSFTSFPDAEFHLSKCERSQLQMHS